MNRLFIKNIAQRRVPWFRFLEDQYSFRQYSFSPRISHSGTIIPLDVTDPSTILYILRDHTTFLLCLRANSHYTATRYLIFLGISRTRRIFPSQSRDHWLPKPTFLEF
uniref:Uncharacterized protein n=1 Tax=Cacopsylla melanoneura TaxID=428564 RepID=A0A8D8X1R6_9HEMI